MNENLKNSAENIINSAFFAQKKRELERITENGSHKELEKKIQASGLQAAFESGDTRQVQKEMSSLLQSAEGRKLMNQLSSLLDGDAT